MADSSDWDLAQRLIERGFCTLDQAREAMAFQDRARGLGRVPPPLPRLLLERGHVTAAQLADLGVEVSAAPPPASPAAPSRALPFALAGAAAIVALAVYVAVRRGESPSRPPDPGPPAEDVRAREELDAIAGQEEEGFANAPEVVRRYREFMGRHAGRKAELEAHRRLEAYRARLEEAARPAREAIRGREPGLQEEGRLAELLALYRAFPPPFLSTTEAGAEVARRTAELSARMEETFAAAREEALRHLAEGRWEEARARAEAMARCAEGDRAREAEALRARIEREGRTTAARLRREVEDEYLALDIRFKESMARRNPREAAAAVGGFLFRDRPGEARRFVRVEGVDYEALRKAVEEWRPADVAAVCDAAADDRERPDPARAALLDLRAAAWVTLFLDAAARAHRAAGGAPGALAALGEEALVALAAPSDGEGHARAGFFCYYAGKGLHFRAYRHLADAEAAGVRGIRPYLANLAVAVEAERGRALEVKLGAAEDCLARKEWAPAKALLEEILKEEDHPFVKGRAARVERMRWEAAQGLLAERRYAELYHGKVETLEGGALRVAYDFEDAGQMAAFEVVTAEGRRRLDGRWRIAGGALESGAGTSAARWRTFVHGDVEAEYALTPLEEPQNIVLALYNNRGEARHYAAVFGFDWVGRSEGDDRNEAEDRFGMPRTCVLKYPVEADRARWREAEAWEGWRARLVGKAAAVWRPVRGKTARIRVARQGASIRVEADGKAVWEGEDADYSEGYLLFFSDCRCRIDDLRIAFTPR